MKTNIPEAFIQVGLKLKIGLELGIQAFVDREEGVVAPAGGRVGQGRRGQLDPFRDRVE